MDLHLPRKKAEQIKRDVQEEDRSDSISETGDVWDDLSLVMASGARKGPSLNLTQKATRRMSLIGKGSEDTSKNTNQKVKEILEKAGLITVKKNKMKSDEIILVPGNLWRVEDEQLQMLVRLVLNYFAEKPIAIDKAMGNKYDKGSAFQLSTSGTPEKGRAILLMLGRLNVEQLENFIWKIYENSPIDDKGKRAQLTVLMRAMEWQWLKSPNPNEEPLPWNAGTRQVTMNEYLKNLKKSSTDRSSADSSHNSLHAYVQPLPTLLLAANGDLEDTLKNYFDRSRAGVKTDKLVFEDNNFMELNQQDSTLKHLGAILTVYADQGQLAKENPELKRILWSVRDPKILLDDYWQRHAQRPSVDWETAQIAAFFQGYPMITIPNFTGKYLRNLGLRLAKQEDASDFQWNSQREQYWLGRYAREVLLGSKPSVQSHRALEALLAHMPEGSEAWDVWAQGFFQGRDITQVEAEELRVFQSFWQDYSGRFSYQEIPRRFSMKWTHPEWIYEFYFGKSIGRKKMHVLDFLKELEGFDLPESFSWDSYPLQDQINLLDQKIQGKIAQLRLKSQWEEFYAPEYVGDVQGRSVKFSFVQPGRENIWESLDKADKQSLAQLFAYKVTLMYVLLDYKEQEYAQGEGDAKAQQGLLNLATRLRAYNDLQAVALSYELKYAQEGEEVHEESLLSGKTMEIYVDYVSQEDERGTLTQLNYLSLAFEDVYKKLEGLLKEDPKDIEQMRATFERLKDLLQQIEGLNPGNEKQFPSRSRVSSGQRPFEGSENMEPTQAQVQGVVSDKYEKLRNHEQKVLALIEQAETSDGQQNYRVTAKGFDTKFIQEAPQNASLLLREWSEANNPLAWFEEQIGKNTIDFNKYQQAVYKGKTVRLTADARTITPESRANIWLLSEIVWNILSVQEIKDPKTLQTLSQMMSTMNEFFFVTAMFLRASQYQKLSVARLQGIWKTLELYAQTHGLGADLGKDIRGKITQELYLRQWLSVVNQKLGQIVQSTENQSGEGVNTALRDAFKQSEGLFQEGFLRQLGTRVLPTRTIDFLKTPRLDRSTKELNQNLWTLISRYLDGKFTLGTKPFRDPLGRPTLIATGWDIAEHLFMSGETLAGLLGLMPKHIYTDFIRYAETQGMNDQQKKKIQHVWEIAHKKQADYQQFPEDLFLDTPEIQTLFEHFASEIQTEQEIALSA